MMRNGDKSVKEQVEIEQVEQTIDVESRQENNTGTMFSKYRERTRTRISLLFRSFKVLLRIWMELETQQHRIICAVSFAHPAGPVMYSKKATVVFCVYVAIRFMLF